MRKVSLALITLFALLHVLGCASIVAPGQTIESMREDGALKWVVSEYDARGFHYAWIPHWNEGLLHVSSPSASNCKSLDVLTFRNGILVDLEELGSDRGLWADVLRRHGRIVDPIGFGEANPLYLAVTQRILHIGSRTELVLFACGFPKYGPHANPRCHRPPSEIQPNDTLYYLVDRGGGAQEIVLEGGRVSDIRPAEHLSKDWIPFYHPVGR